MALLRSYLDYARGKKRFSLWGALRPLHYLAKLYVSLRNGAYDHGIIQSADPCLPVVSVGNLCYGGTNKTPMVEYFARRFHERGLKVGIVSRGYGGASKDPMWIGQDARSRSRGIAGDEPLMLANRLPEVRVAVSADRLKGVALLASLGAEIVVADDAFQHRRMGRDVNIALVDATCPLGNGLMTPAGILRDPPEALLRADIVILTKVDQVSAEELERVKRQIRPWVDGEKLFTARVCLDSWIRICGRTRKILPQEHPVRGKFWAFSAIGNPDSFHRSLEQMGIDVRGRSVFRDHHCFTQADIQELNRLAREAGVDAFICTEKDLHNLPEDIRLYLPVFVPRIRVETEDEERLWARVVECLAPQWIVASNGYGEDAIGALLAHELKAAFPSARVSAFALVGRGQQYLDRGIPVLSPPSEMPSAGLIKYSLKSLIQDIRHGLKQNIAAQFRAWRALRGRIRTPLCVGDVYLMLNALWGQGLSPLLIATAKTVYLTGHWPVERFLMRRRCLQVWTRDQETADELANAGVKAIFSGNPIMDLTRDNTKGEDSPWEEGGRERVLLLPGSRPRAYGDIRLLLEAALLLAESVRCQYVLVPAPTLDLEKLLAGLEGWVREGEDLTAQKVRVKLHVHSLASAASGADILLGLGGTANQVCAGLGVPVVSILEKGKLVQKKLLQDAELLVPPSARNLAEGAKKILEDPVLRLRMQEAGVRRLGGTGAVASVLDYVTEQLGWESGTGFITYYAPSRTLGRKEWVETCR